MAAARAPAALTPAPRRPLSAGQRARRQRILDAAAQLAAAAGYDAFTMKQVADRARVSLGTLYRYFASKDHLLVEVLLAWGHVLSQRLTARPPSGATAAERVAAVFGRMARGVERSPELGIALTRAMHSSDPNALARADALRAMMRGWIDVALGEAPIADREGVTRVLEDVCFGSMTRLARGQRSPAQVGRDLGRAARLLLGA